ncbi:hypothetical protein [Paenibacillus sp. 23TSA30-6]|uniref:hypothetical protein n=1 Tax=Paenibacillus sp. 23TSA30-6 TaxID=2546104 RepID=UPI001787D8EA|nr:hypothetical protein [Paenibacillus sp. 23TSA30-6]MBE0334986.1 hypothetical protein [Paenibacillus sp. 23TSA30-6]
MASEKTPNLGLNQIDRTSPKTTYFDLEKYLDQNWRAVDDFAGDVNDGVNALKKRLDTTERKEVTLSPGVQIVHAEKASPFSLTGLSGRTLVNLLGRDWGVSKTLSRFGRYQSTLNIDVTKSIVGGGSLKITSELANAIADGFGNTTTTIKAGKKYIALGNLYNESATNMSIVIQGTSASSPWVTSKNKWEFTYVAFSPSADVNNTQAMARLNVTAAGQVGYADALRLYEISDTEYTALASMTLEQIASKYPYVDSVTPVRNPYAIRYGENLLPTLYEWSAKQGNPVISDLQSVVVTSDNKLIHNVTPVVPGKTYTLSVESSDVNGRISVTNNPESTVLADKTGSGLLSVTFTVPIRETSINVRLLGTATTPVTISNPMLNIGNTAKPFKPREDSMLALQTDLYADPVTGANNDTVFERDGQYFKSKKWHKVTLDGGFSWAYDASTKGYKVVKLSGDVLPKNIGGIWATKYDGAILKQWQATINEPDFLWIQGSGQNFYATVSATDSGWGDSYTPTADEIKAYFMGWNMYYWNGTSAEIFNNQGSKSWRQINNHGATTSVLPTTQVTPGMSKDGRFVYWEPYQLVYQLATPTVEPIVSEGQLTFNEGDNQLNVGTGIVLRERAKPAKYDNYDINTGKSLGNALAYRVACYIGLYENSKRKLRGWGVFNGIDNGQAIAIYPESYVSDASYSVTYLMLDRSPVVPFTGSCATNEKSLLLDLVDSVQQNTSRVSVLENKKAEKDAPVWITPTLLNGWTAVVGLAAYSAGYYKDGSGVVHMRGWLTGGATAQTIAVFRLPPGYRPIQRSLFLCYDSSNAGTNLKTSALVVNLDGTVAVDAISGANISLYQISFLAEQ